MRKENATTNMRLYLEWAAQRGILSSSPLKLSMLSRGALDKGIDPDALFKPLSRIKWDGAENRSPS
jgi:hypothetical protein